MSGVFDTGFVQCAARHPTAVGDPDRDGINRIVRRALTRSQERLTVDKQPRWRSVLMLGDRFGNPPSALYQERQPRWGTSAESGFLTAAYGWMFLALLTSALTALVTLVMPGALDFVANNGLLFVVAELGLVVLLSAGINRIGTAMAAIMLFVFTALTGTTLAMLLAVFTAESVIASFVGAAAIFGVAALYGVTTGRDLTGLGGILFAGLIGIVIASIANLFVGGDQLSWIIGVIGVLLFTGLTAYDVQRFNAGRVAGVANRENAAVFAALSLYLDFINLFEMLLRLTGSRRR